MFAIPIFDARRFFCADSADRQLTIAASSCLTGAAVRYDGASKALPLLQTWPQKHIRILPLCPEVGAGLAVPRPPVQLVASDQNPQARGRDLKTLNVTADLERFAHASLRQLANESTLCGYIWKSRSPSCGLNSTPLFSDAGIQIDNTSGIQARFISTQMPWLAHIEETHLGSPTNAAQFLLQCRWVLDLRATLARQPDGLAAWHRHYDFMRMLLPQDALEELQSHVEKNAWQSYLALLHRTCENIEAQHLLDLFIKTRAS